MASISGGTTTRQQRGIALNVRVPRIVFGAATAALAVMVLAGCGSPSSGASGGSTSGTGSSSAPAVATTGSPAASTPSSPTAPQATVTIHISAYKYTVPASVAPGATVNVMNMDDVNHTVTADKAGGFDDKATAGMTTTFVAPSAPGSYPFHCIYHADMHGVLVVK